MTVLAEIVDGAIEESQVTAAVQRARGLAPAGSAVMGDGEIGAQVRFDGRVRRMELDECGHQRELAALQYEVYEPMASTQLRDLAQRVLHAHGLHRVVVLHSRGAVPVGAVSFVLVVESPHRAEALAATTDFIDGLKRDVPIWKQPTWT